MFSIRITLLLAFITLIAQISKYISGTEISWMPFMGLILPVLLITNLFFVIYWGIRKDYLSLIPLLTIFMNIDYISKVFQVSIFPNHVNVADYPHQLTIVSYNIDGFKERDVKQSYRDLIEYVKSQKADIVCIQELLVNDEHPIDSIKSIMKDWPFSYIPYGEDIHILNTGIFSKYPINKGSGTLLLYPETSNSSSWCDIKIGKKNIRIFNNHLQTTEINRHKHLLFNALHAKSIKGVIKAVGVLEKGLTENFKKRCTQSEELQKMISTSPYPMLVCGDFNSTPSSYVYRIVLGENLQDGFESCGHGYMYTYRKIFNGMLRIDYIFHSKDFKGMDYFSPNLDFSDHKPVVMKVRF